MVLSLLKIIPLGERQTASKILGIVLFLKLYNRYKGIYFITYIFLNDVCQYKNKLICFSFFCRGYGDIP